MALINRTELIGQVVQIPDGRYVKVTMIEHVVNFVKVKIAKHVVVHYNTYTTLTPVDHAPSEQTHRKMDYEV
jgi:hypothetical protein